MSTDTGEVSGSNTSSTDSETSEGDENTLPRISLRENVLFATGVVAGGFTAIFLDAGYITMAAISGALVLFEVVYAFASVWYTALTMDSTDS